MSNARPPRVILGLNAFHGDAAAALIVDGEVAAAVAEERLNRVKHAAGFPELAVRRVCELAGVEPEAIEAVAVGRDGRAHLGRKLTYLLRQRPTPGAVLARLRARRALGNLRPRLRAALGWSARQAARVPIVAVEHHLAHAAAAFWGSPFERAAILTVDGFGDFVSTAWGIGAGRRLALQGRIFFPHSLGILYQATTQFIGFPNYGDEGKTMGLAPYGQPRFLETFREMVRPVADGFRLDVGWFRHAREGVPQSWLEATPTVPRLWSERWRHRFGEPHPPRTPPGEREADLAASAQAVLEEILWHLLERLASRTGLEAVVLAGGVALNSVANGKLHRRTPFRRDFVFPAAADDGLAVGAAWWLWAHRGGGRPARPVGTPLWGDAFTAAEIEAALAPHAERLRWRRLAPAEVDREVSAALAAGRIVGWFQGRMEFGPRALGARSILADPRHPEMKARLNARVKHREPFRPFAPAILASEVEAWFEDPVPSPAMLHVLPIRPERREEIPAVTHVDGTGRLQTVDPEEHPRFASLLAAFAERTGVPILLNTSFNENEPIVRTPEEAIDCFLRTDMDLLVLEEFVVERR